MNYLSLIIVVAVAGGALALSRRARQRAVAQQHHQREAIRFGTEVMTTAGLYGTVVGINDDETAQLAIAPGVEVKWALAAMRDVASLPPPQRLAPDDEPGESSESTDPGDPSDPPRS